MSRNRCVDTPQFSVLQQCGRLGLSAYAAGVYTIGKCKRQNRLPPTCFARQIAISMVVFWKSRQLGFCVIQIPPSAVWLISLAQYGAVWRQAPIIMAPSIRRKFAYNGAAISPKKNRRFPDQCRSAFSAVEGNLLIEMHSAVFSVILVNFPQPPIAMFQHR